MYLLDTLELHSPGEDSQFAASFLPDLFFPWYYQFPAPSLTHSLRCCFAVLFSALLTGFNALKPSAFAAVEPSSLSALDMEIDILTLFPQIALAPLQESIIGRAQSSGLVRIEAHDLRSWCQDRMKKADDEPFGGGPGMVMKPEPWFAAIEQLRRTHTQVIYLSPQGAPLTQSLAQSLAQTKKTVKGEELQPHLLLLCGHYEGIDQRVIDELVDREISLGDYVLTNGALAAAVLVDCVVRLLPGVLGDAQSAQEESFIQGRLDWPQYTRPASFRGLEVPEILLSGNHEKIAAWRLEQALKKTARVRPDLLAQAPALQGQL